MYKKGKNRGYIEKRNGRDRGDLKEGKGDVIDRGKKGTKNI